MYFATDFSGGQDFILRQGTVEWNGMVIYTDSARGVVNEKVWKEYWGLTKKSKLQAVVANMNKCEKKGS